MTPTYFYGIFLADPILPDGAISGNWLLAAMIIIVAFFLVRFMSQMDKLTTQVTAIREEQIRMRADLDNMPSIDATKLAEVMMAKLFAMAPPPGRQWPFNRTERDEDPGERR